MIELLKVKSTSNPNAVAKAMASILKSQAQLKVQAVGAASINQTVKAIAIARSYLVLSGKDLICVPIFSEVLIDNKPKTAMCFVVKPL